MNFYRKYRPQKLKELFGQEEIAKSLLAQLDSGKISHGYLFWGPKGTGKTSTARILAKAVNCENYKEGHYGEPCGKCSNCMAINSGSFIDLIEIDGASNRKIEDVRDLSEKINLAPAVGKFKVYIIDEVHMLTTEAFNALLKTLEEPPKHAIFILATTEYSKLPATITSRLMKFNFKRASLDSLVKALLNVIKQENIKIQEDAIREIAEFSEGSFRDALSILDQVSAGGGEVKIEDIKAIVRMGGADSVNKFVSLLAEGRLKEAVLFVDKFSKLGLDVGVFTRQLVMFFERLLYVKIGIGLSDSDWEQKEFEDAQAYAKKFSSLEIKKMIAAFAVAEGEIANYPMAEIPVVLAVCKLLDGANGGEGKTEVEEKKRHEVDEEHKDDTVKVTGDKSKAKSDKSVSLSQVEKSWDEFLNRVRPVNAHVFALLRSTKPSSFDGEAVTLEVFYRFHKDKLEEPKIMKMLDGQLEEILGRKVRLRFTLAKKESMPTIAVKQSDVVESAPEDVEKMAHEIFSK